MNVGLNFSPYCMKYIIYPDYLYKYIYISPLLHKRSDIYELIICLLVGELRNINRVFCKKIM